MTERYGKKKKKPTIGSSPLFLMLGELREEDLF
jgi:hypothetical protein